ncbi:hypothetical protein KVT40_009232 [Elsinoe batatas]|uniref:Uncharacterized protein n=1 Tax=Elsinoe batatas TaxID=2601811 RepID=A0A8K0KVW1_9PEZI|nr:hypothetical protein KVT40_009232 [Elsinoe batatas]
MVLTDPSDKSIWYRTSGPLPTQEEKFAAEQGDSGTSRRPTPDVARKGRRPDQIADGGGNATSRSTSYTTSSEQDYDVIYEHTQQEDDNDIDSRTQQQIVNVQPAHTQKTDKQDLTAAPLLSMRQNNTITPSGLNVGPTTSHVTSVDPLFKHIIDSHAVYISRLRAQLAVTEEASSIINALSRGASLSPDQRLMFESIDRELSGWSASAKYNTIGVRTAVGQLRCLKTMLGGDGRVGKGNALGGEGEAGQEGRGRN